MNIVYCIPSLHNPGGMERVLSEKINYLVKNCNYNLTIITTDQKGRLPFCEINHEVKFIDFALNYEDHFKLPLFKKYLVHKKKQGKYRRLLETYLINNKIDICISLCGKEIDFLYKLKDQSKKIAEIHFAKNIRYQFLTSRHSSKFWKYLGNLRTKELEKTTKKLDAFVVLTKADECDWKKTHNNIVQIYNPIPKAIYNKKTFSKLNNKTAIAVGKLDAQKGFDRLIDIWSLVVKQHPDWKLYIWGKGSWYNKLKKQINLNGLENNVLIKGTTTSILQEYLNSSIYVMTSRYEGFPMVLIEAAACGLPLISYNCQHGPSEIIKDGYNGYLIPENNPDLMATKICKLIENRELRITMGDNSKKYSEEYEIENIMPQWISLFQSLIHN